MIRIGEAMIAIALWLWDTDINFRQYPYGPPEYGFQYGLAWRLYHLGLRLSTP